MIIGEHAHPSDLNVNACREKKLTNIRAAGRDENVILTTPREMTLETALEWIGPDELVEVTPKSVRLRKRAARRPASATAPTATASATRPRADGRLGAPQARLGRSVYFLLRALACVPRSATFTAGWTNTSPSP